MKMDENKFQEYVEDYAAELYEKFIDQEKLKDKFEEFCIDEFEEYQRGYADYLKELRDEENYYNKKYPDKPKL